jgi:hypothetical protein
MKSENPFVRRWRAGCERVRGSWRAIFVAALLLAALPRLAATKGQGGVAGSSQPAAHLV